MSVSCEDEWFGGSFYVCKVDGSTPTQACLLRPWTRCFTTIISAWWNLTSSKVKKSEAKFKRKTRKYRQLLSESRFVLRIAPPSLSRDRRIKMKKKSHQRKQMSRKSIFAYLRVKSEKTNFKISKKNVLKLL